MRVVNLAKRPFHNRRPVARLAVLLWILGGLLLAANLWKWGGYLQGSSSSGDRLELLDRQVSQEEAKLNDQWQDLRQVRLGARNQKARYLNLLIHRRTFPWSRLFDELEEVLPDNVYLEEVVPDVELAKEPKKKRRRSRALTPSQARELARQRAAGQVTDDGEDETETEAQKPLRDKVELTLGGFARTENALFHFVDLLYAHDSFLDPNLSRESAKDANSPVEFRIKVVYLTPERETFPIEIDELPPPEGGLADAGGEGDESTDSTQTADGVTAPPEEGATGTAQVATGTPIPAPEGGESETTASAVEAQPELETREQGGRGFVEDTLRQRRERAARRRSDARRSSQAQPEVDDEDSSRAVERSRRQSGGSSRVSVAPRQRGGAAAPVGRANQPTVTAPQGGADRGANPAPRSSGTRTTPSGPTGQQSPRDEEDRGISRPTPTAPNASSSPRLRGMLNLLPEFLRPELSHTEEAA